MKFLILSRREVEEFKSEEKYVVISVRDPYSEIAKLFYGSNRLATLFLAFHDINEKGTLRFYKRPGMKEPYKIIYFDSIQARTIINFFNKWKDKVNLVVVNCEAGICRSSAIAGALAKINGQDDSDFFKYYLPNSLVYRTILEENYRCEQ